MASLRQILALSRSDENPPRSRLTWHRRRRTTTIPPPYQTESDIVPDIPDSEFHRTDPERTSETVTAAESPATVQHDEDAPADDDGSQPSGHASTIQETARSLSRPRGSNPLKSIITRFRHNKSNKSSEQSESSETAQPLHDQAESEGSEAPVRIGLSGPFSPLSRNPPSAGSEATEQQRTVSTQTAETQDSQNTSATVHRHSSQLGLQTPVLELQQDCFSPAFFADYVPETSHFAEGSDPFADRITVETTAPPTLAHAPSKRSSSIGSTLMPTSQLPPSGQTFFSSRHTSNASYASRTCRLDPVRAANGFNSLSEQYNLQIRLDDEIIANIESTSAANKVDQDHVHTRDRVLRRIRPVQSNMEIVTQAPVPGPSMPKLRRTKTFANLTRQKKPMTALQGRSLESMSRLGGPSYLVWGSRLIPGPLQLPTCFVAMILYLRKYGPNTNGLFNEGGDTRAANRLYDYFASDVLDAEKEDSKIAIRLRTIVIPHWEGESNLEQTLIVGVTFQALLTGLPDGLLGSAHLFEVLQTIYAANIAAPIPTTPRIQLITFAIIALASEMQRSLLCATFGLLIWLQGPQSGTPIRRVACLQNLDYLARAFAPTLLGYRHLRDNPEEAGYFAIARLLMEDWQGVNRQLRDWVAGVKQQE
ncbi:hypothetical protein N7481_010738 [Penicillium waksmanii]|uniref:uncharacterized protein n=1 Tax=Penicillium waksmanii TaxID=69791 RepID=UPI002547696B|nr:uncharacterized protein N7481_010738 [Penicillium waksmanii]KAJ5973528.1 hypothetical protein N7481_010738 [Penicillium waksmanii]